MGKLLFVSNITNRISNFATASIAVAHHMELAFFHASNWQSANDGQIQADEAEYNIKINNIPIARSPLGKSNLTAYKKLVELIKQNNIDFIHCNTPVGGLLGRLAGKRCKVKKVIYQVHGFHFYKGAPLLNRLVYYPIERWLARYTDAIITINHEDYEAAQRFKLRNGGKVYYVPGVGIDTAQFQKQDAVRADKRRELGLSESDCVLISAGELNKNKNNAVILDALGKLQDRYVHYILCGVGDQEEALRSQAQQLGIADNVHFLGYRQDMKELLQAADVFVMPSFREGLSRSIMEAMASGLPCVVSRIRGNVDLVEQEKGGYLCSAQDAEGFAAAIGRLTNDAALRDQMRAYNLEKIKGFDISVVEEEIREIYTRVFNNQ